MKTEVEEKWIHKCEEEEEEERIWKEIEEEPEDIARKAFEHVA